MDQDTNSQDAEAGLLELHKLIDVSSDPIFSWTFEGGIRLWNQGAMAIYGYSAAEALGRNPQDLLRTRVSNPWSEVRERLLAEGEWSGYLDHVAKDGRRVLVSSRLQMTRIHDEEVILQTNRDMTREMDVERSLQRKAAIAEYADQLEQANLELRDREQRLLRTNEQLEQFAYIASHDLRSPLRGISQAVGFIREDEGDSLTPQSVGYLDKLDQRVQRMATLLDDLLVYSRIGRQSGRVVEVDVKQLLTEVADMVSAPSSFRIELPLLIPRLRTQVAPLRQVLLNLMGNAVNHHDRDDGLLKVQVEPLAGWYRFRVEDDGPGIPKEYQSRVFEMFQTLHPKSRGGGSGMGLAIAKRIIQHFNGELSLESKSGLGATFTFTWPCVPVEDASPNQGGGEASAGGSG